MLSMGTCDLRTGDFVRYNESLPQASLIDAALASGSVPAFFPYSTFDNHIYVDGGTVRKYNVLMMIINKKWK